MRRKAGTHQECKPAKGSGNDGAKGIHGNGEDQQGERWEFGGPRGCLGIMMFSVCICYWLWLSCVLRDGRPLLPYAPITDFVAEVYEALRAHATPTWATTGIYVTHVLVQFVFALVLPGPEIYGYPVPEEGNKRLKYKCNAVAAWWVSLGLMAGANVACIWRGMGPAPLLWIVDNWGRLLTTSAVFANVFCIGLHVVTVRKGKAVRMTGNLVYDFFMGASLNPRIMGVDLKMFAEIRVSWITLFFLSSSAAAKQITRDGHLSGPMMVVWIAHFLYANACMKGEECVPFTWDIFHEKYGWMLIFWNLAGVPFVYCWNAYFALYYFNGRPTFASPYYYALLGVLLVAYYIWDTAQSQRNHFRMQWNNTFYERKYAFPKLPWRTLRNPKYIETANGKPLLISGWCGKARKIHYTMDIIMASIWGFACGFGSVLPYFYPAFFTSMIIHREGRDRERCAKQYGKDWDRYVQAVPYTWVPYVL